ncbi:MAG: GTP 3',8-cyclase MoaA [Bacillota bacterium]
MRDGRGREINYLRISATDLCNLRCRYCMPADGVKKKRHEEILSYEELLRIAGAAVGLGVRLIRLTGGEPLVRPGLVGFVRALAGLPGIEDLSLTTNGVLLGPLADELKQAGLKRVNISLDTLKPERYAELTGCDLWSAAWTGVEAALAADLRPVKLNAVIIRGVNDDDIADLAGLTRQYPLDVRFIELMPIGLGQVYGQDGLITSDEMLERLRDALGASLAPTTSDGAGPAAYYRLPDARGRIGFIAPMSHSFCETCNRVRLTAEGRIYPCLASEVAYDLGQLVRAGADDERLQAALTEATAAKPACHEMDEHWVDRPMHRIGG